MLDHLDLRIDAGQKVLLTGPNGAGKSTLLRALAGLLRSNDVGDLDGRVLIDGQAPQEVPGQVGLLLQNPTAAVVAATVGRDVAFGLENTGVPREQMPAAVQGALRAARFPYPESRRTGALSGGESQRLALAGALALSPRLLLLDEPTAMLDHQNAESVRRAVLDGVAASGATLVVVEQRLEPWVAHMDRCLVLDADGQVAADGPPGLVLSDRRLADAGVWVPGLPPPAATVVPVDLLGPPSQLAAEPVVVARDLAVGYRSAFWEARAEAWAPAVADVSCELPPGSVTGMTGPSGAGKSTLLAALGGLAKPDRGTVEVAAAFAGRRGRSASRLSSAELSRALSWVPQVAEHGIVAHTVGEEMMVTARALRQPEAPARTRADGLLDVLGLAHLAGVSAYRLSGGEQRRLVLAAALVHGPAALLLDEPTLGQDRSTWAAVLGVCEAARDSGTAVAVAGHDADLLELADSRVSLDHGRPVGEVQ